MLWLTSTRRYSTYLSFDHNSIINNIDRSYNRSALEWNIEHVRGYSLERSSLVDFVNDEQEMFRSLIEFFKEIPEFRSITVDDQILLVKCNLTDLIHIHHVLKNQFVENTRISYLMSSWIGPSFYSRIARTRRRYDYFLEHPIVLKLSLAVLIFTINLSRLPGEDLSLEFTDRRSLIGSQEMYVTLLWNFLNVLFGERSAVQSLSLVIFQYLRYQQLMNEMDLFIGEHFHPDQFHPLTKSVFRLT